MCMYSMLLKKIGEKVKLKYRSAKYEANTEMEKDKSL